VTALRYNFRRDQRRRLQAADQIPTCRMAWMDTTGFSDGLYQSHAVKEVAGMQRAPVGSHIGRYFKTSKTYFDPEIWPEPMTVWRLDGRDPDDILSGDCWSKDS
jgi:hypothetical protein